MLHTGINIDMQTLDVTIVYHQTPINEVYILKSQFFVHSGTFAFCTVCTFRGHRQRSRS